VGFWWVFYGFLLSKLVARHELTGSQVAIKLINKKRMKNSKMGAKVSILG
jgi:hypothetical protein